MTDQQLRFRPPAPIETLGDVYQRGDVSRGSTAPIIGVRHDPGDAGASGPGRRTPA